LVRTAALLMSAGRRAGAPLISGAERANAGERVIALMVAMTLRRCVRVTRNA
jgi:hypothetical protein